MLPSRIGQLLCNRYRLDDGSTAGALSPLPSQPQPLHRPVAWVARLWVPTKLGIGTREKRVHIRNCALGTPIAQWLQQDIRQAVIAPREPAPKVEQPLERDDALAQRHQIIGFQLPPRRSIHRRQQLPNARVLELAQVNRIIQVAPRLLASRNAALFLRGIEPFAGHDTQFERR